MISRTLLALAFLLVFVNPVSAWECTPSSTDPEVSTPTHYVDLEGDTIIF